MCTDHSRDQREDSTTSFKGKDVVANSIIIKFNNTRLRKQSVDVTGRVNQVKSAFSVQVTNIIVRKGIEEWEISGDMKEILQQLNSIPSIIACPNYVFKLPEVRRHPISEKISVPTLIATLPTDDPYLADQWALNNDGTFNDWSVEGADISAFDAWGIRTGAVTDDGDTIIVAIFDTGIDKDHEDLAANIWVNPGEIPGNGIDDDGNGFVDDVFGWDFTYNMNDPDDNFGHGTHCAGIASASGNNSVGIAGVCWNCTVMPVKVFSNLGGGVLGTIVRGIIYAADNGADVISMSWGLHESLTTLKAAMDYAYDKGVVLVASAGNSNDNLE